MAVRRPITSLDAGRTRFAGPGEIHILRTFVLAVLGFVAGTVATYFIVLIGGILLWAFLGVHDQDGGGSMALGLIIGPFFALIGGVVGAFLLPAWIARRSRNAPPPTDDSVARDRRRFIIMGGAIVGGIIGYYAAQAGFWLASPIQFDSYWKAWAVSWLPTLVTALGALAGGLVARTVLRPI